MMGNASPSAHRINVVQGTQRSARQAVSVQATKGYRSVLIPQHQILSKLTSRRTSEKLRLAACDLLFLLGASAAGPAFGDTALRHGLGRPVQEQVYPSYTPPYVGRMRKQKNPHSHSYFGSYNDVRSSCVLRPCKVPKYCRSGRELSPACF